MAKTTQLLTCLSRKAAGRGGCSKSQDTPGDVVSNYFVPLFLLCCGDFTGLVLRLCCQPRVVNFREVYTKWVPLQRCHVQCCVFTCGIVSFTYQLGKRCFCFPGSYSLGIYKYLITLFTVQFSITN